MGIYPTFSDKPMLANSDQQWPLLQHSETKRAASLPSKRSAVTQVFPSSMDTSTRTIPGSCGSWMIHRWFMDDASDVTYLSPLRSINFDACFKSHLYLRHSRQNLSPARTPRTQLLHSLHIIWSPWISMNLHISPLQSQSWRLNVIQFHSASSFGSHNSWLDRQVLHGWDLFLGPKHPWSNCPWLPDKRLTVDDFHPAGNMGNINWTILSSGLCRCLSDPHIFDIFDMSDLWSMS